MMVALERFACAAALAALSTQAWAAAPQPHQDGSVAIADAAASRFCQNIDFEAYSTLEPSGQKAEESFVWDEAHKTYLIRGPRLAYLLDDPGVASIPDDTLIGQMSFRIPIRSELSSPVDRMCQQDFQEQAECDPSGVIIYTQIYTDCDLQRLRHITRITSTSAGPLPLLALSFADVQGTFSIPLYLAADSDLRL